MDWNGSRVQGTSQDSLLSKLWASHQGYLNPPDAYLKAVEPSFASVSPRAPLISRLYSLRIMALRHCMAEWIRSVGGDACCQIVVLGAGLDTSFFALRDLVAPSPSSSHPPQMGPPEVRDRIPPERKPRQFFKYVEIDLEPVVARKASLLASSGLMPPLPPSLAPDGGEEPSPTAGIRTHCSFSLSASGTVAGGTFSLVSADLSSPEVLASLGSSLQHLLISPLAPTMLVSECVLAYLAPKEADAVLAWAFATFPHPSSHFLLHEQLVHPPALSADPFGRCLARYFAESGAPLLSLDKYPSLESQVARFAEIGYEGVAACTTLEWFEGTLPVAEQRRIEALEPFDEFEDWCLTASHYFLLAASRGSPPRTFVVRHHPSPHDHPLPRLGDSAVIQMKFAIPRSEDLGGGETSSSSKKRQGKKQAGKPAIGPEKIHQRWGHTATLLSGDRLLVYGGSDVSGRLGDSWLCDLKTCEATQLAWTGHQPGKRTYHSSWAIDGDRALVFGGRAGPLRPFGDLLHLDVSSLSCTEIQTSGEHPAPRWRHKVAQIGNNLFVSGGTNGAEVFGDLFSLDLSTHTWTRVCGLPPRFAHSMTAVAQGLLAIHGGLDQQRRPLSDLLLMDPNNGRIVRQVTLSPRPLPSRFGHDAVWDGAALILTGDVVNNSSKPTDEREVCVDVETGAWKPRSLTPHDWLLTGHATFTWNGKLAVFGGGSTVFSNNRCYNDPSLLLASL